MKCELLFLNSSSIVMDIIGCHRVFLNILGLLGDK